MLFSKGKDRVKEVLNIFIVLLCIALLLGKVYKEDSASFVTSATVFYLLISFGMLTFDYAKIFEPRTNVISHDYTFFYQEFSKQQKICKYILLGFSNLMTLSLGSLILVCSSLDFFPGVLLCVCLVCQIIEIVMLFLIILLLVCFTGIYFEVCYTASHKNEPVKHTLTYNRKQSMLELYVGGHQKEMKNK